MALKGLKKLPTHNIPSGQPINSEKKIRKPSLGRFISKLLVISAWLFSLVVLLDLEPVSKVSDTLLRVDSFLRYMRSEDKEFEKHIEHKYAKLQESIDTVQASSRKCLDSINKKLESPMALIQGIFNQVFDVGYQLLENFGGLLQTYVPQNETSNMRQET